MSRLAEGGASVIFYGCEMSALKMTEHTMVRTLDQVHTRAKRSVIINHQ